MSFSPALPAELESAAGELHSIGRAAAGSMAATTVVVPAAADEVSSLTAAPIHELFVTVRGDERDHRMPRTPTDIDGNAFWSGGSK